MPADMISYGFKCSSMKILILSAFSKVSLEFPGVGTILNFLDRLTSGRSKIEKRKGVRGEAP